MSRRLGFAVVALLAAGVAAWLGLRGGSDRERQDDGSPAVSPGRPTTGARPRPSLAGDEPAAPADPPFEREPKDPARAPEREQEIRRRVDRVLGELDAAGAVRLDGVDCRSRRCQLVVAGAAAALDRVLAAFQDDRGFYGWAREMMLQDLRREGGRASVTVLLAFD